MYFDNRIDCDSIRTAQDLLDSQSFVPLSPADRDGSGSICLCAAALLASAGLRVNISREEALQFDTELADTRDKNLIYGTFAQLGWSADLCRTMVDRNDASTPEQRRETVHSLLQDLRRIS